MKTLWVRRRSRNEYKENHPRFKVYVLFLIFQPTVLRNITERLRLLVQEGKSIRKLKLARQSSFFCVSATRRMRLSVEILANIERECYYRIRRYFKWYVLCSSLWLFEQTIMRNRLFMIKSNLKMLIYPPVCHKYEENDKITKLFCKNAALG